MAVMSNQQAIIRFSEARDHYVARRFHEARAAMRLYRKNVKYEKFTHVDQRESLKPAISVVIVSYGTGHELIECIETVLKQQGPLFEILVVDNGGNETVHEQLGRLPLLWISPPVNLLPSEGRNVGAYFAQSNLLVFLDDDALMEPGYLTAAIEAMADPSRIGLRGRIKPKTPGSLSPPHYDLGEVAINSEFNLEGNMVMRKYDFASIGGFDSLMFGHEGKALTHQAKLRFAKKNIQYRAELVIRHDWATDDHLESKSKRQALGKDYLAYLNETKLDAGVSIILRSDRRLGDVKELLLGLTEHNTYKPIEVMLSSKITIEALDLARSFLPRIITRVMPESMDNIKDIVKTARYENILSVDLPAVFRSDSLEIWVKHQRSNQSGFSLTSKKRLLSLNEIETSALPEEKKQYLEREASIKKNQTKFELTSVSMTDTKVKEGKLTLEVSDTSISGYKKFFNSKEFIERYGWLKPAKIDGSLPEFKADSTNTSNKEIHVCTSFEEFRSDKEKVPDDIKVLSCTSEYLYESLSFEVDIKRLTLLYWRSQLEDKPDFILLESCEEIVRCEGDREFSSFIDECKIKKIPVVFWHTDAKEHCPIYEEFAKKADIVGAVEVESVNYYEEIKCASVIILEHAIQPAIHNSVRATLPKDRFSNLHVFMDGWADFIEYRDQYSAVLSDLKQSLHIFDSKWRFMKNKIKELPEYASSIHGYLTDKERVSAVKEFAICLIMTPSLKSTSAIIKEALQYVASKKSVVVYGDAKIKMLDNLVDLVSNETELNQLTNGLLDYPAYKEEIAHKRWREVHSKHTISTRVNTLLQVLKIQKPQAVHPLVSSITITKRPQMLVTNAKKNYLNQTAPNKEWVVVLNTTDVNLSDIKNQLGDVPGLKIYQVSSDKNIGFCLNMAISKCDGEFWAKMDDDDWYGGSYLLDYLLLSRCTDADLIGKRPGMTFMEAEQEIIFFNPSGWKHVDFRTAERTPHMCGASFFGKKELMRTIKFSTEIRSAVDSTWYKECVDSNVKILFSDNYNMTIYRFADKSTHTWRVEDDVMRRQSLHVANQIFDRYTSV